MTAPLEKLLTVRAANLRGFQAQLTERLGALAAIERELAQADDQLREIDAQHAAWEVQWQHWMREDGVLYRGEGYNLHHLKLTAWREDAAKKRMEIDQRRRAAAEQVTLARRRVAQAQQRFDLIEREVNTSYRVRRARRRDALESHAVEELTFHGWATRAPLG